MHTPARKKYVRLRSRSIRATIAALLIGCAFGGAATFARAEGGAQRLHFDWSMPDTYGSVLDPNHLPRSTALSEVRRGPWRVDLEVPHCDPRATYDWSVDGTPIAATPNGPCTFSSEAFPRLGTYSVEVQASVDGRRLEGREQITVEDWLIVSLGDSVASGEGVPEIDRKGFKGARWQDARCHRSAYAGPAVAARRLAERNPRVSITFVHLACSGAKVTAGLLGSYGGIAGSSALPGLPSQVAVLNALARAPTAVVISIGANDVGFTNVVINCAKRRHRHSCFQGPLGKEVAAGLRTLRERYDELSKALTARASPIYLTEYFDPTGDITGAACNSVLKPPIGLFGLNREDLRDAREKLLAPLNRIIAEASSHFHWTEITGIAQAFRDHGYCAGSQRWVTTLPDSIRHQGSLSLSQLKEGLVGTLHPNKEGQEQIATFIQAALEQSAAPSCAHTPGSSGTPVGDPPAIDPPAAPAPCLTPQAQDLPLAPAATHGTLSAPLWILIGLGIAAIALLILTLARGVDRIPAAPALLSLLIGAALIDLGVELVDHQAPAIVLMIAGTLSLITGVLLLQPGATPSLRAGASKIGHLATAGGGSLRLMQPKAWNTTNLVVVSLGAGLAVFFAGITAAVANGQTPPTAAWAAGSAVSGALIGLLVPAPRTKKGHLAAAEAAEAAEQKANDEAAEHKAQAAAAEGDAAAEHNAKAEVAQTAAAHAASEAIAHRAAAAGIAGTALASVLLFIVFVVLLALAVLLATGTIEPHQAFIESQKSITTAVIALASASGSALIGILAPSSSKG